MSYLVCIWSTSSCTVALNFLIATSDQSLDDSNMFLFTPVAHHRGALFLVNSHVLVGDNTIDPHANHEGQGTSLDDNKNRVAKDAVRGCSHLTVGKHETDSTYHNDDEGIGAWV